MSNLELTEEVLSIIKRIDDEELNAHVHQVIYRTLDKYEPGELATKGWHWIREIDSGRELILWIPAISENGTVFALNPGKPGDVPEVQANNAEFVDRDPVDVSYQTSAEVIEHETES